ncbi:hypothetical protein HY500_04690 [Candidatus Woesearchaeota archaeon]|nr:hypothetical protein [Candidatus Woesearchaeota archaeon]
MDVDYKKLVNVVENAKFQSYERLSYSGGDFLLFPGEHTKRDEEDGNPPIFCNPSLMADWDIYFGMNVVPKDFRRPCLLHEILEMSSFDEIKQAPNLTKEEALRQAHDIAREYDNRYARETLSEPRYTEYTKLRQRLLNGRS